MFPMHKQSWKFLGNFHQPFISKVPMIPSEPAILVPNPSSQTKVQRAKHSMHIRSSEFTIVVDQASCLRSQYNCNLVDSKMCNPVNLELKAFLIDPLLSGTADGRGHSSLDDSPDLDNSGFNCKTKNVTRSGYFLCRDVWRRTGMAIDDRRVTGRKREVVFSESQFHRFQEAHGFVEGAT